ncbi:MAG: hypothetical protein NXI00_22615, partial [Cytophagales bacterium]|nr:hypothetical protein [Cytophagales bacterium]
MQINIQVMTSVTFVVSYIFLLVMLSVTRCFLILLVFFSASCGSKANPKVVLWVNEQEFSFLFLSDENVSPVSYSANETFIAFENLSSSVIMERSKVNEDFSGL